MATRTSASLQPSNSTDALFRLWVQFVEDTLVTTGGWVVTADAGQMTISTSTHPSIANTKVGYRVYKMADTLQGTYPVYIRLDYGSAAAANTPAIWPTIGTGSDNLGTITTILWNGGASATPLVGNSTNNTSATNSYGSASTGRFQLGLFVDASNHALVFSLERTKDSSGNDTGDGLLLVYNALNTGVNTSRYIIYAGGSQPTVETGLNYTLSTINPSAFGGDTGIGLVLHFKGVVQQPGLGCCIVRSSDVSAEGSFSASIYGSTRTYQHLNSMTTWTNEGVNGGSTRVCMRYD